MSVIARLYKDAELDIAGEVNERLPKVTNGLLFNLPMDGSLIPETVGRNYVIKSQLIDGYYIKAANGDITQSAQPLNKNGANPNYIPIYDNKFITFSLYDDITGNTGGETIAFYDENKNFISSFNQGVNHSPHSSIVPIPSNAIYFRYNVLAWDTARWKIEFGDKATPWTPANEDVKAGIVATNCNLTNDGIYVEEGTTNLITEQNLNLWSSVHPTQFTINYLNENVISLACAGGWEQKYTSIDVIPNMPYTFSFKYKNLSSYIPLSGYTGLLVQILSAIPSNSDNSTIQISHIILQSIESSDYIQAFFTFTPTTSTIFINFNFGACADNQTVNIQIKDMQLEQKPYATSYTPDTRPNSNNGVQISTSYFQFPFSATMDVIPDIKDGSNSVYGSEPKKIYIAGLWKPITNEYYGEIDQELRNTIINGLEKGFKYTLVYRSTDYDIYINNTKIVSNQQYHDKLNFILSDIPMFTIGCRGYEPSFGYANALYRNIAFYNRELTQDDVNKLCNNKFSITKEGNINGLELIEDDRDMTKMSITKDEIHLNELSEGGDL